MKKIYILIILIFAFTFNAKAQIFEDDFESYTLGPLGNQNPTIWSTWSGATNNGEDITVVDDQANSGTQSGYIGAGEGPQDAMLLLGNKTTSIYTVNWNMYIPSGKGGYYNFQEDQDTDASGGVWAINVVFNEGNTDPGQGIITDDANPPNTIGVFTYPEGEWFSVSNVIDVDNDTVKLGIDGIIVYEGAFYSGSNLGGVDFFALDANNEYYIDDVLYQEGDLLNNTEFSENKFSVYPNPVQDLLNIRSTNSVDAVKVYDIFGKTILNLKPAEISPSIDMSSLSSGAYLVQVTIGNVTKTVKVIK